MERISTETKKVKQHTHFFYCDACGAQLGCTTEYSDGYYPTLGDFELKWFTPKGWYQFKKCLCETCKDALIANVCEALEAAGFTPD